ncbi:MAG TPA: VCBS repeat-containing protein [Candidatus Paceibacterota bacterium]|nr:VCBS repeat-containing protein [Verrucomicrobiota bacterium]HRY49957.1 VCBS repeat-containing protein [Candidatus Paceibacterota bacterium]HRZ99614.1 VCBS repeat-containing protein [Candidatus Paceibacterota bacterium]
MKLFSAILVLTASACALSAAGPFRLHSFQKLKLSDQFYCEGAHAGDFNRDGKMDVVIGPFVFVGPDFKERFEFRSAKTYDPGNYSDNFLTFTYDFNQDGWIDILVVDIPGKPACWYQNPQGKEGHWTKYLIHEVVENESPTFGDITGDGKPELIFNTSGQAGYAAPDWANPTQPWKFHPVTSKDKKWQLYTHGLGFGDVDGDGRSDLLEYTGWWKQPGSNSGDPLWAYQPVNLGEGGAQILVYDFSGDGLADIVTCLHPHQYGLAWFQQQKQGEQRTFQKHVLMGKTNEESPYGIKMTQIHAFDLVDMDRDGVMDFVTGKRWWAHKPPTDPESDAPAMLYWFRTHRLPGGDVDFVPYVIDNDSGVGTQVIATDLNGDQWPDVIVGNKKGCFVFLHQVREVSEAEWTQAQPKRTSGR